MKSTYTASQLAMMLHKTIEEQKKRLKKPIYPEERIEWVKSTAMKLIEVLGQEALKFNDKHPQAKIMSNDLTNALNTAINVIMRASEPNQNKK